MNHTVAAIFDRYGDAQSAMNALFNDGFTRADVKLSPAEESTDARQQALGERSAAPAEGESWGIGDFFRSLFSSDQHSDDAGMYSEAVRRGGYLLSIDAATEEQADRAADILAQYQPVDLDQRAGQWRSAGWTGYQANSPIYTAEETRNELEGYSSTTTIAGATPSAAAASSGAASASTSPPSATPQSAQTGEAIPVVEEQLQVGKRAVQRGGVRIYRHVTETPVQESVQLREEHVSVQRTPVDQPASAADIDAFKEGTLEVRETAEEAVVGKTARVVEEVQVGKEVTERTETISDTVRRTDVEVEPLGSQATAGSGTSAATVGTSGTTGTTAATGAIGDDLYRQHWQSAYGSSGGQYEDYASAYRYGADLAGRKQYQGYRWDELEPQVRADWETSHQGSPWERTKQAVRYGWEKMSGR